MKSTGGAVGAAGGSQIQAGIKSDVGMGSVMLSPAEVITILRETGAYRDGHFELPAGMHTNNYFQMPMAMRSYSAAKQLSVGLSRLLRGCPEVARALPNVSIIAPPSGGIPVAFGIGEALRANQIYWAERENGRFMFRQFMGVQAGEKCILIDDILRYGTTLQEMVALIRSSGGEVVALGVLVDQRIRDIDFGSIPLYSLVEIKTEVYSDGKSCRLCREGSVAERVRI